MKKHSGINHYTEIISAYVYLQVMSLYNLVLQRLKRLKQPRYMAGALFGAAYIYYFFIHRTMGDSGHRVQTQTLEALQITSHPLLPIAAFVLFLVALLNWLIPTNRAALQFTEAEVAFLFPAPVTRKMLIHFKLLRSQFSIIVSALFMTLVFGQLRIHDGNPYLRLIGWLMVLSTINLHIMAASFTRERLLDVGVTTHRRRVLILSLMVMIACACWWTIYHYLVPPTAHDVSSIKHMLSYITTLLDSPPLSWLLLPFKWVIAPIFADTDQQFAHVLWPAALILIAHYFWVVRSDVAFEEASIDLARRRAERITAMREGTRSSNKPLKPRTVPFKLAAKGFAPIAFLWKGLISLGPLYRFSTWLIICAVIIAGSLWMMADPKRSAILNVIGGISVGIGAWLFIAGPMFMTRGLRKTLEHLDILKASPLHGWQIVLGELLSPITLMTFMLWLVVLIASLAIGANTESPWLTLSSTVISGIGVALIAAPLSGLMLCVPFAAMLFFPAWIDPGAGSGGIEAMGQRMLFFIGYFVLLFIVLIPVGALGGLALLTGYWLGNASIALIASTIVCAIVLCVELYGAVLWLGQRLENFDLSLEMPR